MICWVEICLQGNVDKESSSPEMKNNMQFKSVFSSYLIWSLDEAYLIELKLSPNHSNLKKVEKGAQAV